MKKGRSWRGVVGSGCAALAVAAAMAPGCTIVDDLPPFDAGVDAAPDSSVGPQAVCNRCIFRGCTVEYATCQSDPECQAIYGCATEPTCAADQACVDACRLPKSMPARQKYFALALCNARAYCTTCTSECPAEPPQYDCSQVGTTTGGTTGATTGGDDGGSTAGDGGATSGDDGGTGGATTGATTGTTPPESCDACSARQCSTELAACAVNDVCTDYFECVALCASGTVGDFDECIADVCETQFGDGKRASDALGACTSNNCSTACFAR